MLTCVYYDDDVLMYFWLDFTLQNHPKDQQVILLSSVLQLQNLWFLIGNWNDFIMTLLLEY